MDEYLNELAERIDGLSALEIDILNKLLATKFGIDLEIIIKTKTIK